MSIFSNLKSYGSWQESSSKVPTKEDLQNTLILVMVEGDYSPSIKWIKKDGVSYYYPISKDADLSVLRNPNQTELSTLKKLFVEMSVEDIKKMHILPKKSVQKIITLKKGEKQCVKIMF